MRSQVVLSFFFIAVPYRLVLSTYELIYLGNSHVAGGMISPPLLSHGDLKGFELFELLRAWRDKVFYLATSIIKIHFCQSVVGLSFGLMFRLGSQSGRRERPKYWHFGFAPRAREYGYLAAAI